MSLSLRFDPPLSVVAQGLMRASERLVTAVEAEMREIAERARATAREKTPGKDLPDGWQVHRLEKAGAPSSFVLVNVDPRAYQLLELSDGRLTNLAEMLEYGTRPHEIKAKPGGTLAFFWPAVGAMVFAQSVHHPGTKPYAMIRTAYRQATGEARALGAVVGRVIGRGIL